MPNCVPHEIEVVGRYRDNTFTGPFRIVVGTNLPNPLPIATNQASRNYWDIYQIAGSRSSARWCGSQLDNCFRVVATWHRCRICDKYVPRSRFHLSVRSCMDCVTMVAPCIQCGHDIDNTENALRTPDIYGYTVCRSCWQEERAGMCECGTYSMCRSRGSPEAYSAGVRNFVCARCVNTGVFNEEDSYDEGDCEDYDEDEADGATEYIYEYGYKPRPNFLPGPDSNKLFLGVELEADGFHDRTRASEELAYLPNKNYFYMKADSSLSNGIEVVTHPATLKFHQEELKWNIILNKIKSCGAKSHYTRTCGLHIHINKDYFGATNEEANIHELKLLYIFQKFWTQLLRFSRRDPTRALAWSSKFNTKPIEYKRMTQAQYTRMKGTADRHKAINITGQYTIEIRLFRGTLSIDTLFATLELVDFLATLIKTHTAPTIYRLTWAKLVERIPTHKYHYLLPYLEKKKLKERAVSCVSL